MAEKRTTTPALMTHVMMVGLPAESAVAVWRLFLEDERRSLGELDRRLILGELGAE